MFDATTIVLVKHRGKVVIAGDGQVTFGNTVMKAGAKKVRKLYNGKVIGGFAGAAADAFALFSKFEEKLEKHNGNITRAAVELAKDWRTDKILRKLEALLLISDGTSSFVLSGTGDVIEPDDGVVGIGSGGPYVLSAARALVKHSDLSARKIAEEAMKIAASVCIYTNENISVEEISNE
ncbi:MAG: ATP-dependent protease subunit HslV [Nitrospinota bacterium]